MIITLQNNYYVSWQLPALEYHWIDEKGSKGSIVDNTKKKKKEKGKYKSI